MLLIPAILDAVCALAVFNYPNHLLVLTLKKISKLIGIMILIRGSPYVPAQALFNWFTTNCLSLAAFLPLELFRINII